LAQFAFISEHRACCLRQAAGAKRNTFLDTVRFEHFDQPLNQRHGIETFAVHIHAARFNF